jgi:hypothetical protein
MWKSEPGWKPLLRQEFTVGAQVYLEQGKLEKARVAACPGAILGGFLVPWNRGSENYGGLALQKAWCLDWLVS